jgi:RHH-type rel operon transcriptional repressor/antitoxin RelB
MTKQLEVQLPTETAGRLAELARSTGRSETFLAELAINRFVEAAEWEIQAIKEGIAAADRGEVVEHAEVMAWLESLGTDHPLPRPKPRQA